MNILFSFFEEPLLVPRAFSPSVSMKWVGKDYLTIIPYNMCDEDKLFQFKEMKFDA